MTSTRGTRVKIIAVGVGIASVAGMWLAPRAQAVSQFTYWGVYQCDATACVVAGQQQSHQTFGNTTSTGAQVLVLGAAPVGASAGQSQLSNSRTIQGTSVGVVPGTTAGAVRVGQQGDDIHAGGYQHTTSISVGDPANPALAVGQTVIDGTGACTLFVNVSGSAPIEQPCPPGLEISEIPQTPYQPLLPETTG
jgi:hypothetical protein